MSVLYFVALAAVLGLFIYLLVELFYPERFS